MSEFLTELKAKYGKNRNYFSFLSKELYKNLSEESRELIDKQIKDLGLKVYTESDYKTLCNITKAVIIRFGNMPTGTEARIAVKGGIVVPGNW